MKHIFDLNKIWAMQEQLDSAILRPRNRTYEDTLHERALAFIVELGEFANEARDFKYWSNKESSPRDILIEEYIDGIHFIVSQGILFKCKRVYEVVSSDLNAVDLTIEIFRMSSSILKKQTKDQLEKIIYIYLQLGMKYNFFMDDLTEHYIKKNKVNYQRIKDNY